MLVDFGFSYLFAKEFLLFIASLEVTYGGPQLSRQNQKPHGKNENITAKPKTSRQKQNTSRQNQKPHGKSKIPHGKTKNLTAKTKYPTAKSNTSEQQKTALVLPWVFAFAVRFLFLP